MERIYYDKDASLGNLKRKTVGVIGYGIQGRAQALNIRDSGVRVLVANRADGYARQARRDGFKVHTIDEVARRSHVILFLIPDQAQADVYEKHMKNNLRPGSMLVFAHGFAPRYETIAFPKDIDVAMLAPRMPGHHIRNYFLSGSGVPAFVDVIRDATGEALERILAVAKAAGFTRSGVLRVSYRVEAELDLFTEQFLVAAIVGYIHTGFKVLVDEFGYPPVPVLMELYASGELAEVLKLASQLGIGMVFQKNASPTCQFGIAENFNAGSRELSEKARRIVNEIQSGLFAKRLDKEGKAGYRKVRKLWETVNNKRLADAQGRINGYFKQKGK